MTQTVYSEENMRVLLFYVIIPLIVILFLFFIGTKVYEHRNKDKDRDRTNYVINYWSNVMGIIFTAILLSVSVLFVFIVSSSVFNLGIVVSIPSSFPVYTISFVLEYK